MEVTGRRSSLDLAGERRVPAAGIAASNAGSAGFRVDEPMPSGGTMLMVDWGPEPGRGIPGRKFSGAQNSGALYSEALRNAGVQEVRRRFKCRFEELQREPSRRSPGPAHGVAGPRSSESAPLRKYVCEFLLYQKRGARLAIVGGRVCGTIGPRLQDKDFRIR